VSISCDTCKRKLDPVDKLALIGNACYELCNTRLELEGIKGLVEELKDNKVIVSIKFSISRHLLLRQ